MLAVLAAFLNSVRISSCRNLLFKSFTQPVCHKQRRSATSLTRPGAMLFRPSRGRSWGEGKDCSWGRGADLLEHYCYWLETCSFNIGNQRNIVNQSTKENRLSEKYYPDQVLFCFYICGACDISSS